MADINFDNVTDTVRDVVYVGIGVTVIGFQKLQVQRQELIKTINTQVDDAKGSFDNVSELVEKRVKVLEGRLEEIETRLESLLAEIEATLPEQARELVAQARDLVGRAA